MVGKIEIHECYCKTCASVISNTKDEIVVDFSELRNNDRKHSELRGKLRLPIYDFNKARSGRAEVPIEHINFNPALRQVLERKGKISSKLTKVDGRLAKVDMDDLFDEIEEHIKVTNEVVRKGNKLRIKPHKAKPKRVSSKRIEYRCPFCGEPVVIVRLVIQ